MNDMLKTCGRTLVAGLMLTNSVVAANAVDGVKTYRPYAAMTFAAGEKRGVGYFVKDAARCKLVLTIADASSEEAANEFTALRHEELVPAGAATRYNTSEGRALEFSCLPDAVAMSVREIERLAGREKR